MSRQRSRSPLHSRTSTLGRQDGYYGEQYHAPVHSDLWRGSGNVSNRNVEDGICWDKGSSQTEEEVDHWAKFIEAIGHPQKRKAPSTSRYHAQVAGQNFEEDPVHSPRQLPRERLSSPEALHYGVEVHQRIQSPGQRRNEHDVARVDRRYSRSSSPRHSHGKRHDRMDHGYHVEDHEVRYERSSYSERSLKSNYSEHRLHFKGYKDLDPQAEYTVSHRGFSQNCAPVIVEHDHGILKHDARIHNTARDRERPGSRDLAREHRPSRNPDPGRNRERPRIRDPVKDREQRRSGGPVRDREHPKNHDPLSQREHERSQDRGRGQVYPRGGGPVGHQEHPRSHDPVRDREPPRSRDPLRAGALPRDRDYPRSSEPQRSRDPIRGTESSRSKDLCKHVREYIHHPGTSHDGPSDSSNYHSRGSPLRGMLHHKEQPRMGSHSREPHGQRAVDAGNFKIDEGNRARASVLDWDKETQPRGNHGGVLEQGNILKRNPQHKTPNGPGARTDFDGHETLKIKVDMSRPLHQSSLLGCSSERQLSLDLVNVGRQRLDFLPMLEHSGTFRETPMHSGTFAQEIITLVHQVKENYFQGQGVTLNERFSNEQEYSLTDEFAEQHQEMEGTGPVVNRMLQSSRQYRGGDFEKLCFLYPCYNRLLGSASSDTQIFCNIGPMQSQRKLHVPAPGDLRHDLERKRQERLEGVKITITGGSFSQILPQSQENESAYVCDDDPCEAGWSEELPQQTERWDEPRLKRPAQNFNARRNFIRTCNRPGPRPKRNAKNSAQW